MAPMGVGSTPHLRAHWLRSNAFRVSTAGCALATTRRWLAQRRARERARPTRNHRLTDRRLVKLQPITDQIAQLGNQIRIVDGFDDVAIGSENVALVDVPGLTRRSEYHDRQRTRAVVTLDAAQDFESVDLRQLQIKQHHAW